MQPVTLQFQNVAFLHRWSESDQHEFTPAGQEDLEQWSEMLTVNRYRQVSTGEDLAATANAVLEKYKQNRAMVVRTDSVPRTEEKPAEYLIVVLFPTPGFIEAAFTRFKLVEGKGAAVIFSHREYGEKIGNVMSAWLQKNGPVIEKALMQWDQFPPIDAFSPDEAKTDAGSTAPAASRLGK